LEFPPGCSNLFHVTGDNGISDEEPVRLEETIASLIMYALSGHHPDAIMISISEIEVTMSHLNLSKTERIDVRASSSAKQLLQDAARACHKNVSEFLLDAGVTAANLALADRRHFALNKEQWHAFQDALDRPVQAKPRLKKLLSEAGVLE
jgi:uncharacterized protein (DUF1778 family)